MLRASVWGSVGCLSLLGGACTGAEDVTQVVGAGEESTAAAEVSYLGAASFAQVSDLPGCNAAHAAEVYYVSNAHTFYYCDGRRLAQLQLAGADGQNGKDGSSWLVTSGAAALQDCPNGGVSISVGPDLDGNLALDANERVSTDHVCSGHDGAPGADGTPGADALPCTVTQLDAGSARISCPDGSTAIIGTAAPEPSHCQPNPCQNGGSCSEAGDAFACACAPGFGGPSCETPDLGCGAGSGGSCTPPVAAFRANQMDLKDPHVFVSVPLLGCADATSVLVGPELNDSLSSDRDFDGQLDFSPLLVFPAFNSSAATQRAEFYFAQCSAPLSSTMCRPGAGTAVETTATFRATGECAGVLTDSVHPYSPPIVAPAGPCFDADLGDLVVPLAGIPVPLRAARLAAHYQSSTGLSDGLLYGFLTDQDATNTSVPVERPFVGGHQLSALLPGGAQNCVGSSDRDMKDGVAGWWFYINFSASNVPWVEH